MTELAENYNKPRITPKTGMEKYCEGDLPYPCDPWLNSYKCCRVPVMKARNAMTEPMKKPPIAESPLSVVLMARALDSDTSVSLRAWKSHLDRMKRPYEILLIQESRPEIMPEPVDSDVRVFSCSHTDGFRTAVNDAIQAAQHPLLVLCPCDRQYSPVDLAKLLGAIDKVDLVAGYRLGGQAPPLRVLLDLAINVICRILVGLPMTQRLTWLGGHGWDRRWIARWIFGVRVTDPECAFLLARRGIFKRIPIQSGGPFLATEILAKANHLTCLLAEVPVTWNPPSHPLHDAISFGGDAQKVFLAPDFGPYPIN
ncbi:MAG: glycosyltransferase [Gemmataceae bacterium]|nr:glycosyltransferase [Gemmataceae bacterium]